jgi:hypothetical protein
MSIRAPLSTPVNASLVNWLPWSVFAYSGPCRSPIPAHADHPFRLMPITDSSVCRSPVPAEADHFSVGAGIGIEQKEP